MKFPLMVVDWVDSAHRQSGWNDVILSELEDKETVIRSIGWQIFSGSYTIILAPHIDELSATELRTLGELIIPLKCIKQQKQIQDPFNYEF